MIARGRESKGKNLRGFENLGGLVGTLSKPVPTTHHLVAVGDS
jgi:hypothetical protein